MDALRKSWAYWSVRASLPWPPACLPDGRAGFTASSTRAAAAMMSINAVKGVEIGDGFAAVMQKGSAHRDEATRAGFLSNHAGGILGGISSGRSHLFRGVQAGIQPAAARARRGRARRKRQVVTTGRHDPCVGIRATPDCEAMLWRWCWSTRHCGIARSAVTSATSHLGFRRSHRTVIDFRANGSRFPRIESFATHRRHDVPPLPHSRHRIERHNEQDVQGCSGRRYRRRGRSDVVGVGGAQVPGRPTGRAGQRAIGGRQSQIRQSRGGRRGPAATFDPAGVDIALFSAGGSISKEYAPKFAAAGAVVIDNSSAFRYEDDVPLVVSEVNPEAAKRQPRGIIANPNCSTMQLAVALAPIHRQAGIERLNIATYQSVSGTGRRALEQAGEADRAPAQLPVGRTGGLSGADRLQRDRHGGDFTDNGYTTEEMKLVWETRKILGDDRIWVNATVVRVPVFFATRRWSTSKPACTCRQSKRAGSWSRRLAWKSSRKPRPRRCI